MSCCLVWRPFVVPAVTCGQERGDSSSVTQSHSWHCRPGFYDVVGLVVINLELHYIDVRFYTQTDEGQESRYETINSLLYYSVFYSR